MRIYFHTQSTKQYDNAIIFYSESASLDSFEESQRASLQRMVQLKKTSHSFTAAGRSILVYNKADAQDVADIYRKAKKVAVDFSIYEASWSVYFVGNFSDAFKKAAVLGLGAGCYQLGFYKKEQKKNEDIQFAIPNEMPADEIQATLETQFSVMDLVNGPGNMVHAKSIKAWAEQSGATHKYQVEYFDVEKLKSLGFGALLAIGAGSPEHSGMLILHYKHPDSAENPVALIGKGVTFDTGGYSIKGANNMHYMKCDMGGGAAVLGAVELIAKLKLPVNVVGVVPMAQNSISGQAALPGDVVKAYSGHSIEIIDTDAEGRMLLADATSYTVANLKPTAVINIATLTGSSVRTFGYNCAALFSNNEKLQQVILDCGQKIGERAWPLPVWKEYEELLRSDIADIRNLGGPVAGAITAAKFIQFFTDNHPNWAHLDIAGVAFGNNPFSKDKSATGFGVALLKDVVENL